MEKEQSIFMMKPCGLEKRVLGHGLSELVIGLFVSSGLNIQTSCSKKLEEADIRNLYPILNIPDPVYGEAWKQEVIDHLTSQPVLAYLLEGINAIEKAKIIKNHLRNVFSEPSSYRSKVVENIAHVPDAEEFSNTYRILFGES